MTKRMKNERIDLEAQKEQLNDKKLKDRADEENANDSHQIRLLQSLYETSLMIKDNRINEDSLVQNSNFDSLKVNGKDADDALKEKRANFNSNQSSSFSPVTRVILRPQE